MALLRERYGDDGRTLIDQLDQLAIAPHDNPSVGLAAIQELLNRGWGVPVQTTEMSGLDGIPLVTKVVHEYHPAR